MKLLYEKTSDEDIEEIYELCKQLIHDYEQLDTINYPKVMNWVRNIMAQLSRQKFDVFIMN